MSQPFLAARGVTRSFGPTLALRGADLSVDRHEIVAVMGPSGSGKSTLLYCLAGILTPDAGQVLFDGTRVDQLDEPARTELRRRRFGFVFQFGQLVPELSAVENVALPLLLEGRPRRQSMVEAAGWLERLGIGELGARRPGELSGGEAQRVALARAVVAEPDVIFADEPTGSLDSFAGEQVMDLLVDSARAQRTTVLIVTHDARVAAYADREVVVRDGIVVDRARAAVAS